jgi:hypothetical protein
MKRHSMFLRKECELPPQFDLAQRQCADNWMLLDQIDAPVLETMIRHVGWHLLCLRESYSRSGVGLSGNEAVHEALARALKGVRMHFNAAELESIEVFSYPVFHIATITLQPRNIQQHTPLETAVENPA